MNCQYCNGWLYRDDGDVKCLNSGRPQKVPKPQTTGNLIAKDYLEAGWRFAIARWNITMDALYSIPEVCQVIASRVNGNSSLLIKILADRR